MPVFFTISLCDLSLQLHFEFSLELSYTSSEHKLELVQPISFSPPSQKIVYLSHLEFLQFEFNY
jgi:hypothetical protein